jgi:phage baseplate assembly protein W
VPVEEAIMDDLLGTDLKVIPFFVAHDAAEVDLSRRVRPATGRLAAGAEEAFDLDVVSGRENVAHALILRLLTPRGALANLGHSSYGSRLHELIGRGKTDALRNLCRAFVLEVVAQEPRIESEAVELTFDPAAETAESFVFILAVRPVSDAEALTLSLEVAL